MNRSMNRLVARRDRFTIHSHRRCVNLSVHVCCGRASSRDSEVRGGGGGGGAMVGGAEKSENLSLFLYPPIPLNLHLYNCQHPLPLLLPLLHLPPLSPLPGPLEEELGEEETGSIHVGWTAGLLICITQ